MRGKERRDCLPDDKIMEIKKLTDSAFKKYGKVVMKLDFTELLKALEVLPIPEDVVYVPSVETLENTPVFEELQRNVYGELPIQIGYCNGKNYLLNAVEYHRSSEINVMGTDAVLLLGSQQDIGEDFTYDTSLMEAFLVPAGTAVELYATTLHYAPCSTDKKGFRVAVVLPKNTNCENQEAHEDSGEDALLAARNKWLIGHAEGGLPAGTHLGLRGKNLDIRE